jgi:mannose-1-phosphate guanylyltransferase
MSNKYKIIPVILAGGEGKRIYPLSMPQFPKQFLSFYDEPSFFQQAIERAGMVSDYMVIVTNSKYINLVKHQLQLFKEKSFSILCEPQSKNTAAAVCAASIYARKVFGKQSRLWIKPSDHIISNYSGMIKYITSTKEINNITCFGLKLNSFSSNMGYMHLDSKLTKGLYKVDSFVEKPIAEQLINFSHALCNSGMYVASAEVMLAEIKLMNESFYKNIKNSVIKASFAENTVELAEEGYNAVEDISIDKLLIEKTNKLLCYKLDTKWQDIGSWSSLYYESLKNRFIDFSYPQRYLRGIVD